MFDLVADVVAIVHTIIKVTVFKIERTSFLVNIKCAAVADLVVVVLQHNNSCIFLANIL